MFGTITGKSQICWFQWQLREDRKGTPGQLGESFWEEGASLGEWGHPCCPDPVEEVNARAVFVNLIPELPLDFTPWASGTEGVSLAALSSANTPGHHFPQAKENWEHPCASQGSFPWKKPCRVPAAAQGFRKAKAQLSLSPCRARRVALSLCPRQGQAEHHQAPNPANTSWWWCLSSSTPGGAELDRDRSQRSFCLSVPVSGHLEKPFWCCHQQVRELLTCPGLLPTAFKSKAFAGTTGSKLSTGYSFPQSFGFFFLNMAPGLAFINEYCSSEHLGTIPDSGSALGRAMEQQSPKEGNRNREYWMLLCSFRRSLSCSVTARARP